MDFFSLNKKEAPNQVAFEYKYKYTCWYVFFSFMKTCMDVWPC